MGVVVVGNHALFISKDLDDMTVWDDLLHVSCCSSNVAFWVHKYLTEGNVIVVHKQHMVPSLSIRVLVSC